MFVNFRATLTSQADGSSISNGHKSEVVDQMQVKVNELCTKIDELQRELDLKSGLAERKFYIKSQTI